MNSEIIYSAIGTQGHFWILDDDPRVIAAAKAVLQSAVQVSIAQFVNEWTQKTGFRLLVIDSSIRIAGERAASSADDWLKRSKIASDVSVNTVVVLYSGDPKDGPWHRSFEKSGDEQGDVASLAMFFTDTIEARLIWSKWPERLAPSRQKLSRAIHGLENLAVPLRIDVETLDAMETEGSAKLLEDVWREYFGQNGYLTENRRFTDTSSGLEGEILRFVAPLVGMDSTKRCKILNSFLSNRSIDPVKVAGEMKIAKARAENGSLSLDATNEATSRLRNHLQAVAGAIRSLAYELRNVRDAEEKCEEGTQ